MKTVTTTKRRLTIKTKKLTKAQKAELIAVQQAVSAKAVKRTTTHLTKALTCPIAQKFVDTLNRQEVQFRDSLSLASIYQARTRMIQSLLNKSGADSTYLRDAVGDDVIGHFSKRPTLVFSTDVMMTKEQQETIALMDGWNVYAMVYNMEDQCGAVLIKNHGDGIAVKNSTVKVQKWGMVYPNGHVRTSTRMPIAQRGSWGEDKKLKKLPKEAAEMLMFQVQINNAVDKGVKKGRVTIEG